MTTAGDPSQGAAGTYSQRGESVSFTGSLPEESSVGL